MRNTFASLFLSLLLLNTCVFSQQQAADTEFDAQVARPAYIGRKHSRVLFDEAHNNVHTTTRGYKPFADLISNDGYVVTPNKQKFQAATLKGYVVLVIVNAMGAPLPMMADAGEPAFTDEECDAVRDWVRAGGSLLLITDHAPTGSAAKTLASRFGVEMSTGVTGDDEYYNQELKNPGWLIFTREPPGGLILEHPITSGRDKRERVARIETFTGQSLKVPSGGSALLKLSDKAYDVTPENPDGLSAAGRAQAIALKYGKGRIVVLGEAAMLTAQKEGGLRFGMNREGNDNRQLALNIMHWLSGLI